MHLRGYSDRDCRDPEASADAEMMKLSSRGESSPRMQPLAFIITFLLGWMAHACLITLRDAPAATAPPNPHEERGPPTKTELGNAGWTLLHVIAANFPDEPTHKQEVRMEALLRGLGEFYPCPTCAAHFRGYVLEHPVVSKSRKALSLWLCGAHNDVNKRNHKEEFYCDLEVLDARWKDCGCDKHANNTTSHR